MRGAEVHVCVLQNRIAAATNGGRVSWTSDGAERKLFDKVDEVEALLGEMEDHKNVQHATLTQVGQLMSKFDAVARTVVDPQTASIGVR